MMKIGGSSLLPILASEKGLKQTNICVGGVEPEAFRLVSRTHQAYATQKALVICTTSLEVKYM